MPGSKLDLTLSERKGLRTNKIKVKEIHHLSVRELQDILQVSKIRAMELCALSEFQSLPSVGVMFANDLISMGYYSLKDLRAKNPAQLLNIYENQVGAWADPCVEDMFRLGVHHANNPGSHKTWWNFTAERKAFREKYGYPSSRPKRPWFDLPRFKKKKRKLDS